MKTVYFQGRQNFSLNIPEKKAALKVAKNAIRINLGQNVIFSFFVIRGITFSYFDARNFFSHLLLLDNKVNAVAWTQKIF